jgi:hypothetical protein
MQEVLGNAIVSFTVDDYSRVVPERRGKTTAALDRLPSKYR